MPEEVCEDDELVGYDPNTIHKNTGAVVLIEGVLYGSGRGDQDYAKYPSFPGVFFSPWTYPIFTQQAIKTTRGIIPGPSRSIGQIPNLT